MARLDPTGVSRILSYIKTWVTTALGGKANSSHSHTKSQITDFPSIPSKTSQLTNDSGFLTSHQDLSGYVPRSGANDISGDLIPSTTATVNLGSLNNIYNTIYSRRFSNGSDTSQYLALYSGDYQWGGGAALILYGKTSTLDGMSGGEFALAAVNELGWKRLIGSPNGSLTWEGTAISLAGHTHTKSEITDFPTIPTNTSQLSNDSGYITSSGSCNYANSAGYADSAGWANHAGQADYLGDIGSTDRNGASGTGWYSVGISYSYDEGHNELAINNYWGIRLNCRDSAHVSINGSRINVENATYLNGYQIYVG